MAAPHVTGAAALPMARYPELMDGRLDQGNPDANHDGSEA